MPWLLLATIYGSLNSVEPRRAIREAEGLKSRSMQVNFEGFAVFLAVLQIWVERSKVCSVVRHAVVEPLMWDRAEERVSKEFFVVVVGGGAPVKITRGRAAPQIKKAFDSTKGFPGEDVSVF